MNIVEKTSNTSDSAGTRSQDAVTGSASPTATSNSRSLRPSVLVFALLMGMYFGIVLVKSEVVRWQRVHDMFLFREAHMYLIITVGIVVAAISIRAMKWAGMKTIQKQPVQYKPKPWHLGVMFGGILFGSGWAITGACPGPIYAQIGGGELMALITLAGALLGMFTYAVLKPKLPH